MFWIDSKSMTDEQRACQGTNNSPGEDKLKHNAVSVADGDLGSSKFVVLWCLWWRIPTWGLFSPTHGRCSVVCWLSSKDSGCFPEQLASGLFIFHWTVRRFHNGYLVQVLGYFYEDLLCSSSMWYYGVCVCTRVYRSEDNIFELVLSFSLGI